MDLDCLLPLQPCSNKFKERRGNRKEGEGIMMDKKRGKRIKIERMERNEMERIQIQ